LAAWTLAVKALALAIAAVAAWVKMTRRYPHLPPEMRDSVYHHLCALDLF
jgi:hypothetical protein